MSHQESYYRHNQAYAEFIAGWDDEGCYEKYADTLKPGTARARVLDVGCGVGTAVARLSSAGFEAYGVEVSEPMIAKARESNPRCQLYDGRTLPFPDKHFAAVGALNVLEHVDEPEAFVAEIVRVVAPGGRIVLSSPNFYRVIGFRDYHPRMRGLGNKWRNWRRLRSKRQEMRASPSTVRFDRMPPITNEPFSTDYDAVVATNGLDIGFSLERNGCVVESVSCTDRYVAAPLDWLLNLGPWRYLMLNSFVIGRRI